jgi:predicted transcriptional regulator
MNDDHNIIMSLEARHADNILAGTKRVELRRRPMNVATDTTVWFYVKLPIGRVLGQARVKEVHKSTPSNLWHQYSKVSGLTFDEFSEYFDGSTEGVALVLGNVKRLSGSVTLSALRSVCERFQPPQFFKRLQKEDAIMCFLAEASMTACDAHRRF